jgi:hypothetical protein
MMAAFVRLIIYGVGATIQITHGALGDQQSRPRLPSL